MASGPLGVPRQTTASVGPGWGKRQSLKVGKLLLGSSALCCCLWVSQSILSWKISRLAPSHTNLSTSARECHLKA